MDRERIAAIRNQASFNKQWGDGWAEIRPDDVFALCDALTDTMDRDYGLTDLISDVTNWHVAEFGPGKMATRLASKLKEEAEECALALYDFSEFHSAIAHVEEEIADVLIVLCAIAGRNCLDPMDAARKKLEIVKARNQKQRDEERGIE